MQNSDIGQGMFATKPEMWKEVEHPIEEIFLRNTVLLSHRKNKVLDAFRYGIFPVKAKDTHPEEHSLVQQQ